MLLSSQKNPKLLGSTESFRTVNSTKRMKTAINVIVPNAMSKYNCQFLAAMFGATKGQD